MNRKRIEFTYKTLRTFLKSVYFSRKVWYNKNKKRRSWLEWTEPKF